MKKLIPLFLILLACNKHIDVQRPVEEIQTARPDVGKNCTFPLSIDTSKRPDLNLWINIEQDTLYPDGSIDYTSYSWIRYGVRAEPVRLDQNYLTTGRDYRRYGWDSGIRINRVRLVCLVENIAPYDTTCKKDWEFNESQASHYDSVLRSYMFEGLFEFETFERGNGNSWKTLPIQFKKEFFPSVDKVREYQLVNHCGYYANGQRAIQAQTGDFYYNYFMFPNHDGVYKLTIKFNPLQKGCRAVRETDYSNNEKTFLIEIRSGRVLYSKQ